jgi:hypothetical protein
MLPSLGGGPEALCVPAGHPHDFFPARTRWLSAYASSAAYAIRWCSSGVAQEKAQTLSSRKAGTPFHYDRDKSVYVNHYYFYIDDEDFGPVFLKVCSYAALKPEALLERARVGAKRQILGHAFWTKWQKLAISGSSLGPTVIFQPKFQGPELDSRGLKLCAGFVMANLEDLSSWAGLEQQVLSVGNWSRGLGGQYLVLIDDVYCDIYTSKQHAPARLDESAPGNA